MFFAEENQLNEYARHIHSYLLPIPSYSIYEKYSNNLVDFFLWLLYNIFESAFENVIRHKFHIIRLEDVVVPKLRQMFLSVGAAMTLCVAIAPSVMADKNSDHSSNSSPNTAANSSNSVLVTVNTKDPLATISPSAIGVNTAAWDQNLLDKSIPKMLKTIGVEALRFPGGSTADNYNWETGTTIDANAGGADPNVNFNAFMNVAKKTGASPIITVNYGSNFSGTGGGEPQEAAAWVKYANILHHDHVEYWEIGNEVYGNGFYGAQWEIDLHHSKSPQTYAQNVIQFSKAMKAVDPKIQIGVVLTCPFNWPWGVKTPADWNKTVLNTLKQDPDAVNFVIVHWYAQNPGNESDSGLLSSTSQIPLMMSELRQEISNDLSPAAAKRLKVFVTETNSVSYNPGKQTTSLVNALFLDDDMLSWLQSGAANVDWWDLHNGAFAGNTSPSLYGNTTYGDYGLLSNGSSVTTSSGNTVTEPPVNTPFPTYYGFELAGDLVKPGATIVGSTASVSDIAVHATQLRDGKLAVMIINKNPNKVYQVSLDLKGFRPNGTGIEYTYGEKSSGITYQHFHQLGKTISVQPYSVTDFIFNGSSLGKNQTN
ncbi:hypothetical protein [Alicyclobacillus tolerans]|uniref:Alpha-L-arabinofuranosidase n=1 Tax=Alicyclobacillus tolerans TaxID=90970 RepID=A0ABT9LT11_9BACL|nr:hypothetical protein [Alicyclobacillus tengchongensis]MDP9727399.1 hypothetical protein [Alicyclobacillus tengchongensis]